MTENVKNIIMKHRHILLADDVKQRCSLNERDIFAAATLPELDEAYTRRVHNFESVVEMYKWSSSINYLQNINRPMVFINSKDDPLVPEELLLPIKEFAGFLIVFIFFLNIHICFSIAKIYIYILIISFFFLYMYVI